MRRLLLYSRIAWSASCGIVVVLLMALWIRSYWWRDQPQGELFSWWYVVGSRSGHVHASIGERGNPPIPAAIHHVRMSDAHEPPSFLKVRLGFATHYLPGGGRYVQCPHWFVVSLAVLFAALPWFRYRFTTRIMLIATTIV